MQGGVEVKHPRRVDGGGVRGELGVVDDAGIVVGLAAEHSSHEAVIEPVPQPAETGKSTRGLTRSELTPMMGVFFF